MSWGRVAPKSLFTRGGWLVPRVGVLVQAAALGFADGLGCVGSGFPQQRTQLRPSGCARNEVRAWPEICSRGSGTGRVRLLGRALAETPVVLAGLQKLAWKTGNPVTVVQRLQERAEIPKQESEPKERRQPGSRSRAQKHRERTANCLKNKKKMKNQKWESFKQTECKTK